MNFREWALPVYTILVQLGYGALLGLWLLRAATSAADDRKAMDTVIKNPLLIIFITITIGMFGAHFHLSRPVLSFLAILNLSNSWLSREILFNLLFFLAIGWLLFLQLKNTNAWGLKTRVGWLAILLGTANVFCMAHIYLLPTQLAWNSWLTILSFFITALLLGVTALISIFLMDLKYAELRKRAELETRTEIVQRSLGWFALAAGGLGTLAILVNFGQLYVLSHNTMDTAQMSLLLLLQLYPALFIMRLVSLILGVMGLGAAVVWRTQQKKPVTEILAPSYVTFLLIIVGEILGRFIFYATHVRLGL